MKKSIKHVEYIKAVTFFRIIHFTYEMGDRLKQGQCTLANAQFILTFIFMRTKIAKMYFKTFEWKRIFPRTNPFSIKGIYPSEYILPL